MEALKAAKLAATGDDASFWSALGRGEFVLSRCAACTRWLWPVPVRCSSCGSQQIAWSAVEPDGVVYSWTRTWYPFVEARGDGLPYVVLVVELPHAGNVRVLGVLRGDEVAVGDRVVGRIEAPSASTFSLPSVTWEVVRSPHEVGR